jgi:hypothetical protein
MNILMSHSNRIYFGKHNLISLENLYKYLEFDSSSNYRNREEDVTRSNMNNHNIAS